MDSFIKHLGFVLLCVSVLSFALFLSFLIAENLK